MRGEVAILIVGEGGKLGDSLGRLFGALPNTQNWPSVYLEIYCKCVSKLRILRADGNQAGHLQHLQGHGQQG